MTHLKPHIMQAVWNWLNENKLTPYLMVDTRYGKCSVPSEHVNSDGKIILNISANAAKRLVIDQNGVSFNGTFSDKPYNLHMPLSCIMAIYAKENGQGFMFSPNDFMELPADEAKEVLEVVKTIEPKKKQKPSFLTVVK